MSKVTSLVQNYGSNRMNAHRVGGLLAGCEWVGIAFAGGMCEIPHIKARTIVVNDLHRGLINLAWQVKDRPDVLMTELRQLLFHPDTLDNAQHILTDKSASSWEKAVAYFVVSWMSRSGSAITPAEKTGGLSLRWEAGGGDSAKRYQSAIDGLEDWGKEFRRCTFTRLDVFEFLDKCKDRPKHGIYCDPPFIGLPGKKYLHNCGETADEQLDWHSKLSARLSRFREARVVVRAYDTPEVRTLYKETAWSWHTFEGRKQTNQTVSEVLLVRN